jgi:hypothetical protein
MGKLKSPAKKKSAVKKKKRAKRPLDIGDRVCHLTYEPELEWTIIGIWDTNVEGDRAELSRPDKKKKLKIDRMSAQLTELAKVSPPQDDSEKHDCSQKDCPQEDCPQA